MPKYKIFITHVDNRLEIKLNDVTIYDHTIDNDPVLHEELDITDRLQPNPFHNQIEFFGYNAPLANPDSTQRNPWHFEYKITKDGEAYISVGEHGQNASDGSSNPVFGIPTGPGFIPVRNMELVHQRKYAVV